MRTSRLAYGAGLAAEGVLAMVTAARTARWFENPRLVLGALAVSCLSALGTSVLGYSGPLAFVLATQIVLFVGLFRRPVWAMAALLVGQFTASSYMLTLSEGLQMSIRFLWTILTVLLLVPVLQSRGGIDLGSRARSVIVPAAVFFAFATVANFVNVDVALTVKYLRQALTALIILALLPAAVRNEKDLKIFALVALVTGFVSGMVAVMQHYSFRGLPVYTLYPEARVGARAIGLAESPVHLAYDLPILLLPMASLWFLRGVGPRARKVLMLLAPVMVAGLVFTYTRSGMYSLGPGLLAMLLLMRGKAKKRLLLVALVLVAAFLFYADTTGNRYSKGFAEEDSAAGRIVLWQAALAVALDNPILGIGYDKFERVATGYSGAVEETYLERAGGVLGRYDPHNDFLRVWLSFGTPALLAFLWLFAAIFRNFLDSYRWSSSPFLKGLSLGCFGALVAYIVNAATHNTMDSVFILWILGGLSVALVKLVGAPESSARLERS